MENTMDIQALTNMARLDARRLIDRDGTVVVANRCGISRDALGRLVAGLPTQRGTVLSVAHALGLLVVPTALALSSLPHAT